MGNDFGAGLCSTAMKSLDEVDPVHVFCVHRSVVDKLLAVSVG